MLKLLLHLNLYAVIQTRKRRYGDLFTGGNARKNIHILTDLTAYFHTAALGLAVLYDIQITLGRTDLLQNSDVGNMIPSLSPMLKIKRANMPGRSFSLALGTVISTVKVRVEGSSAG